MPPKRYTKKELARIAGVDVKTLNKEIRAILSDDALKQGFGEYRKRLGFTETQYSIIRKHSPLFDF